MKSPFHLEEFVDRAECQKSRVRATAPECLAASPLISEHHALIATCGQNNFLPAQPLSSHMHRVPYRVPPRGEKSHHVLPSCTEPQTALLRAQTPGPINTRVALLAVDCCARQCQNVLLIGYHSTKGICVQTVFVQLYFFNQAT